MIHSFNTITLYLHVLLPLLLFKDQFYICHHYYIYLCLLASQSLPIYLFTFPVHHLWTSSQPFAPTNNTKSNHHYEQQRRMR